MPLETKLIEQSVEYSLDKLKNTPDTECPNLFFLTDFLHPTFIDKFVDFITTNDLAWQGQEGQEYKNRLKINWVPDSPIEEAHIIMEHLTESLNKKFSRNNKFIGISVWKDQEGYFISQHIDNKDIDVAIQIYLTGETENLGTTFEYNNLSLQAQYQKNCGYLIDDSQQLVHSMSTVVPKDHIRYSLYAIWSSSITPIPIG